MLELRGAGRVYGAGEGAVHALSDVSLTIGRGEFVTIMGPSGSGKSTLLAVLGLLDGLSAGSYSIEGRDVSRLGDTNLSRLRSRHFGYVFQSFQLFPELTALQNVMMPLGFTRCSRGQARLRAEELLDMVGLAARAAHRPGALSGGEQQRVAIARALANDPDVILADEPTGNLPRDTGASILEILTSLNGQGVTLVVVTHDEGIGAMGRRRLRLVDGRLSEEAA
jgi:putative ABC transport system ATP-binding protein